MNSERGPIMSPKVSLIIPTHRREDLLKELLLSLRDQTLDRDKFEVLVVVDGKNDPAWPMLQALDVPYALRPVQQDQSGASVTRNHGARIARGDVLVFLDDDMLPGKRFLEEHLRMHEAQPHAVVLGAYLPPSLALAAKHGGWNVWEARVLQRHYGEVASGKRPPAGRRLYSGNFSVPRHDFWRVGGFDETLERGEDVELGFRLEREGLTFLFGAGTGAVHRGFRGFSSWCRSAELYGQSDALLGDRAGRRVNAEVLGWYHRQKAIARWAVRLCTGRPFLHDLVVRVTAWLSQQATELRLYALAHYGYSSIYKLQYWRGFIEELGGEAVFERHLAAWRAGLITEQTSVAAASPPVRVSDYATEGSKVVV